jgi:hypothetical protein
VTLGLLVNCCVILPVHVYFIGTADMYKFVLVSCD